jgi:SAM-dependent methyltransferase
MTTDMAGRTERPKVAPGNQEQLRAWDGDEGAYWAEHAEAYDKSLAGYQDGFMAAAAIGPGDRVLDVGCGTGQTTRAAARVAASGRAHGVDLSARMLDVARALAAREGVRNIDFEQADAQVHPFPTSGYDVAISRTALMFFADRRAGFANLARALRPGGRLCALVWQPVPVQEWVRDFTSALAAGRDLPAPPPDAPSPFSLADPDVARGLLTGSGFVDVTIEPSAAPMWFGDDPEQAYDFVVGMLGWMVASLDDASKAGALAALRRSLDAHAGAVGVAYESGVWTITASRPT